MDAVAAVVDSGHRPKVVVDAGMNLGFSVTTVRAWVPWVFRKCRSEAMAL